MTPVPASSILTPRLTPLTSSTLREAVRSWWKSYTASTTWRPALATAPPYRHAHSVTTPRPRTGQKAPLQHKQMNKHNSPTKPSPRSSQPLNPRDPEAKTVKPTAKATTVPLPDVRQRSPLPIPPLKQKPSRPPTPLPGLESRKTQSWFPRTYHQRWVTTNPKLRAMILATLVFGIAVTGSLLGADLKSRVQRFKAKDHHRGKECENEVIEASGDSLGVGWFERARIEGEEGVRSEVGESGRIEGCRETPSKSHAVDKTYTPPGRLERMVEEKVEKMPEEVTTHNKESTLRGVSGLEEDRQKRRDVEAKMGQRRRLEKQREELRVKLERVEGRIAKAAGASGSDELASGTRAVGTSAVNESSKIGRGKNQIVDRAVGASIW